MNKVTSRRMILMIVDGDDDDYNCGDDNLQNKVTSRRMMIMIVDGDRWFW